MRDGEGAEVGFELDRVEVGAGASPVLRRELEVALLPPVREEAHERRQLLLQ